MLLRENTMRVTIGFVVLIFWQISAGGQTLSVVEDTGRWHREKIQAEEAKLASLIKEIKKEARETRRLASESKALREAVNRLRQEMEKSDAEWFRFSPLPSAPTEELPAGDYDMKMLEDTHG